MVHLKSPPTLPILALEVLPTEPEQFAGSETACQPEFDGYFESVALCCIPGLGSFVPGANLHPKQLLLEIPM